MDIAEMYQSRGESESGSKSAMATYRRLTNDQCFNDMKLGKYDQKIKFMTEGTTSRWRWWLSTRTY